VLRLNHPLSVASDMAALVGVERDVLREWYAMERARLAVKRAYQPARNPLLARMADTAALLGVEGSWQLGRPSRGRNTGGGAVGGFAAPADAEQRHTAVAVSDDVFDSVMPTPAPSESVASPPITRSQSAPTESVASPPPRDQ
jgi:hypothetical protein